VNTGGCFLTVGSNREPEVILLSEAECNFLDSRIRREGHGRKAYEPVFGPGVDYAFPCWSKECMGVVAETYTGNFEAPTRWFAARIALDMPYSREELEKGGDGDGAKIVTPKPRKPPGGNAEQLSDGATEEREVVLAGAVDDSRPKLKERPRRRK
jgi:hypothetical protein